jgi:hypothetical protein
MRHPPTNVVLALFKLDLSRLNEFIRPIWLECFLTALLIHLMLLSLPDHLFFLLLQICF